MKKLHRGPAAPSDLLLLASLVVMATLPVAVQRESLTWANPGSTRLLAALAVVLAYLLFCLALAWRRRVVSAGADLGLVSAQVGAHGSPILVIWASQTGRAEALARRSAQLLVQAGRPVRLESLATLTSEDLAGADCALFVVSTSGEGDPPDMAAGFARNSMGRDLPLPGLRYGLLALGDREYVNFCGFGRQLDAWLRHQGAQAMFDRVEVDNSDEGTLRHWQHQLGVLGGGTDQPDWTAPRYQRWRLTDRRLLNPGSAGSACFHLALKPEHTSAADWQAGDIVEIGPRHAAAEVAAFAAQWGLALDARVPGTEELLGERLARSHWPDQTGVADSPLATWLAQLKPLPHREYSIASVPGDGSLDLLVRQWRRADGSLGLGAGWLTERAQIGDVIDVRLRTNSNFHLPADDCPLILIGNGTGIAGLRALLKARIQAGRRRNWLLFGERQRAHDFLYDVEIQAWQAAGWIARLDLAFSRDQSERIYVQHRLKAASHALREWVEAGAAIYVCGSLAGMAPAVDEVLVQTLGSEQMEQIVAQGRYRRDVY